MATSWRAACVGKFTAASWTGEQAQCTFSGPGIDAGGLGPGHINSGLNDFDAVADGTAGTATGMTVSYGSVGSSAWSKANQDSLAVALSTWLTAIKIFQSSNFQWQEIRLSALTAAGAVVNGASIYTLTTPISCSATITNGLPPQNAMGVSMATGGRGPRNRGRVFIPLHQSSIFNGDGILDTSSRTTARNATKTLVDTVNAISALRLSVVSRTNASFSDIIAIKTGDEGDTQRRRRNHRPEVYVSSAVTS